MKKLIFDIDITGHHSEYIGNLVDSLELINSEECTFIFVVHPEFKNFFPKIVEKAYRVKCIRWEQIRKKDYTKSKKYGTVLSSFIEYSIVNSYARKFKVDQVLLLNFHSLKFPGMIFRPKYKIRSILFHTFHRLSKKTLIDKFQYYKRYYIIKYCAKNKNLIDIFILNDQKTVNLLNIEFKTNQFKLLPDPIPNLVPKLNFDINDYYNIPNGRKVFLHIGSLGYVKGTLEVFNAAKHIDIKYQENITLLVVGKARSKADEELFFSSVQKARDNTNVQVIWDNNFVPNNMMKSLFDDCDVVLLPYKNTEFSSGILGHAAMSRKPVIATGRGLIKELVVDYNLGVLLEEPTDRCIAKKIMEFVQNEYEYRGLDNFVKERNPKIFSKILLSN